MAGYITGMVIYDSRLFNRTGAVGRWATSVSTKFEYHAVRLAPFNKRPNKSHWDAAYPPGSLKRSIEADAERIGPRHWQIVLHVGVPYAGYVIHGTTDVSPIVPNSAKYMTLPRNPGFRRRRHNVVAGQRRNPFLRHAARAVGRSHSSVRNLENLFEQW